MNTPHKITFKKLDVEGWYAVNYDGETVGAVRRMHHANWRAYRDENTYLDQTFATRRSASLAFMPSQEIQKPEEPEAEPVEDVANDEEQRELNDKLIANTLENLLIQIRPIMIPYLATLSQTHDKCIVAVDLAASIAVDAAQFGLSNVAPEEGQETYQAVLQRLRNRLDFAETEMLKATSNKKSSD